MYTRTHKILVCAPASVPCWQHAKFLSDKYEPDSPFLLQIFPHCVCHANIGMCKPSEQSFVPEKQMHITTLFQNK